MCKIDEKECIHSGLHEKEDDCVRRKCGVIGMFVCCEKGKEEKK